MSTLVSVKGLNKSFGSSHVVRNLGFDVEAGEVLGFLGPNGAGKSTTMKMITGFLEPDSGRVVVAGSDVAADPVGAKRRLGYLPEGAPLYEDMTTRSFLGFIARMRGLSGVAAQRRLDEVATMVNLGGVMEQNLETLSKGFKRRVGIAQAIIHDPPVLILDEPTDGLDPNQKHEVRQLIRQMAADKAIVLSTHILEEVGAVCSRAIIVANGEIVADDTPASLERHGDAATWSISVLDDAVDAAEISDRLGRVVPFDAVRAPCREHADWRIHLGDVSPARLRAAFADCPWPMEIHRSRGRLDEVFREITGGERRLS